MICDQVLAQMRMLLSHPAIWPGGRLAGLTTRRTVSPYAAAGGEMRRGIDGLPEKIRAAWLMLADALDPIGEAI